VATARKVDTMDDVLGFITAVEEAREATQIGEEALFVYPRLNHNGGTTWCVDPDEMEIIEADNDVHPDCTFFIEIRQRDHIEFVPRTEASVSSPG